MIRVATLPDVVGMRVRDARRTLEEAGFTAAAADDPPDDSMVIAQEPGAGTDAAHGSSVRIESSRPDSLYVDRLPRYLTTDQGLVRFLRGFQDVGTALYDRPNEFPKVFDPHLTSPDVARWMAGWIGVAIDGTVPDDRVRATVSAAMEQYRARGTAGYLRAVLTAATGAQCEVIDPGGVHLGANLLAGGDYEHPDLPDEQPVELTVRLRSRGGVSDSGLAALVESTLPAWLPYRFVVEEDEPGREATDG